MKAAERQGRADQRMARMAKRRLDMEQAAARLMTKLAKRPDDSRVAGWKRRLAEYDHTLRTLDLEFELAAHRQAKPGDHRVIVPGAKLGVAGGTPGTEG